VGEGDSVVPLPNQPLFPSIRDWTGEMVEELEARLLAIEKERHEIRWRLRWLKKPIPEPRKKSTEAT
jgi:hypothetical protein